MKRPPEPRLTDLPFLIVALALGFQALLKRLRATAGLRENVAIGMGSIFFALCEVEGCIMKDLGTRLRMPKGTLSGLVVRMEKMKLIERWPCPDDGRAVRIRLTRKARALEATLHARHAQAMSILQSGLSKTEIGELQRLLGRVLENLRADENTVKKGAPGSVLTRPGRDRQAKVSRTLITAG